MNEFYIFSVQSRYMVNVPFVDLKAQYRSIQKETEYAVSSVLSNCNYILGEPVQEFEKNFASYIGVKAAIGVSSGLDALRLSLAALDIKSEDEVIIPANTFIATALAVSAQGAKPVLVDCDPETYNIDVNLIQAKITSRTKAIMPVHLTGQAADMDPILELAKKHNLHIIEDTAQAHGTLYKGRMCGILGNAGCYSFYPSKNLGACGDGGIVVTNDMSLAEKLKMLRNYGQKVRYEHLLKGLNARLDTVQAAILNIKLKHLDKWNKLRATHAQSYRKLLSGVGDIKFQKQSTYSTHIYHLFIVETNKRDELQTFLNNSGIQTAIHYPKPIHLQEAYKDLGYKSGDFPKSEALAKRILSLPMYAELTEDQIQYVAGKIKEFFK